MLGKAKPPAAGRGRPVRIGEPPYNSGELLGRVILVTREDTREGFRDVRHLRGPT